MAQASDGPPDGEVRPPSASVTPAQTDPDLRRQHGPHVFVDDLDAPELAPDDHHHLGRSLRLRPGDALTLSDGNGRWRKAAFDQRPVPTGAIVTVAEPAYPVTLAVALAKGSKPETVVQKATELGVDRVVIFHGQRSVPSWDMPKQAKAHTRLTRVAREAAMQSRRVRLPEIGFVADLRALVDVGAADPAAIGPVRADFGGVRVDDTIRTIAIGPEGGWSPAEQALVPRTVDLGPTVLRAETAAIIAAGQLVAARTVA